MKYFSAFLMLIAVVPSANGAQMGQTFANLYSITNLGSVSGIPIPYAALLFQSGEPNVLLLAGNSAGSTGEIYTVPVTRDATRIMSPAWGCPPGDLLFDGSLFDGAMLHTLDNAGHCREQSSARLCLC